MQAESKPLRFPNHQAAIVGMILPAAAWYTADYTFHALEWFFYASRSGVLNGPLRLDYHAFLGDPFAWGGFLGRWFTLTLPGAILLVMAMMLRPLSWKLALRLGLAICLARWLVFLLKRALHHDPFYITAGLDLHVVLIIALAGPLAATAASKIDLAKDIVAA